MRKALLVLILFSSLAVAAVSNAEPTTVPVVALADFIVGRSWTWDYFEPNGKIYSTERYTILKVTGSKLLIEMASDYNGGQNLQPHHRLLVDLSLCLGAYRNRFQKKPWHFKMFYLNQGAWKETEQGNTLAFEEKFNCNAHVYSKQGEPYLTVVSSFEGKPAFMQKLWRRIEGTWFSLEGLDSGFALGKAFTGNPGEVYTMKLRAQTSP